MSASLLGAAMKAKLGSRTRKLVLIKLVDCCHEDGTHIYPALATVAEDAECSIATARRTLKEFVAVGLLRKVRDGGSGRRSTNHYEMDVELLFRLRRPEFWPALEAAALHQPLPDNDDDEATDEASRHAPDASEGENVAPSCETKGSTVIPYHGDTLSNGALRVSPDDTQPLSRTLSYEREGVRAHEPAPASEGEPAVAVSGLGDDATTSPAPSFEDFIEAYPHAKGDNRVQLRSAWAEVPFDHRRAAIDGIGAFLAERKAGGLKSRLSAPAYLAGRCWVGLEAQAAKRAQTGQASAPVVVSPWSRDWWLLLHDRIKAGRSPSFWVQQAEASKASTVTGAEIAAASARIGALQAYRCDGPEIEAWRLWLAAKGARIPLFRGEFRVFLPGPTPPGDRRDAGDDEVRF